MRSTLRGSLTALNLLAYLTSSWGAAHKLNAHIIPAYERRIPFEICERAARERARRLSAFSVAFVIFRTKDDTSENLEDALKSRRPNYLFLLCPHLLIRLLHIPFQVDDTLSGDLRALNGDEPNKTKY